MKKKKLSLALPLIIVYLIAFMLLVFGSIKDQEISAQVTNKNSFIGVLLSGIGYFPGIFIGAFGAALLIVAPKYNIKAIGVLARICAVALFILVNYLGYKESIVMTEFQRVNSKEFVKIAIFIIYITTDLLLFGFAFKLHEYHDLSTLLRLGFTLSVLCIGYAFSSELIKWLASRPRPDMVLSGAEEFKKWYQFRPFYFFSNEGCKSFVSGHTANCATTLTALPILLNFSNRLGKKKFSVAIGFIAAFVLTFGVGYTRVVVGSHYLTDVAGGIIISLIAQGIILGIAPAACDLFKL